MIINYFFIEISLKFFVFKIAILFAFLYLRIFSEIAQMLDQVYFVESSAFLIN